jgi:tripartite-type tricarboxylate transporter receptor subunit TctC
MTQGDPNRVELSQRSNALGILVTGNPRGMLMSLRYCLLLFAAFLAAGTASAQERNYPLRPITLVVPAPAGGPGDTVARLLSEPMRGSLGQPVIIENVGGANGTIGTARVARAKPDGYTLLLGNWNSHMAASAFYAVQYDVVKDFEPISLASISRLWLVGKAALPPKDAEELIAWLKGHPNQLSVASVGTGSAAHVCGIHFRNITGTQFQFVFYRGGGPAYQDLVAGHVDLMCAEASATLPLVREGKIKAYGVMAKTRWFAAPTVPTMEEVGVPDLYSLVAGLVGSQGNASGGHRQPERRRCERPH